MDLTRYDSFSQSVIRMISKLVIVPNMQVESSIPAKFMNHSNKRSQIVHLSLERLEKRNWWKNPETSLHVSLGICRENRINSTIGCFGLWWGRKGLSTEDLLRCDYLVTLPTWEGYPITNLSHAVHTLTYELHRNRVLALQGKDKALPNIVPIERSISPEQRKVLRKAIQDIAQFLPAVMNVESHSHIPTRALQRSGLETDQTNRLIGGFVDASTALEFATKNSDWKSTRRRRVF